MHFLKRFQLKLKFLVNSQLIPLLAAVVIPLQQKGWSEISFGKIPANKVEHSAQQLKIQVKSSASPLVYKLDHLVNISSFQINLKFSGDLKAPAAEKKWEEDSLFRIGLVAKGDKTLSGVKKLFAPDWVKKLFALAPEGIGLDKIYFYNVGRTLSQMGLSRPHPKSELMNEEIVAVRKTGGNSMQINKSLNPPVPTSALWISVDGDDTNSEFQTTIENITLQTTE